MIDKTMYIKKKLFVLLGGHHLRELGNEDNQTKLIKAVDNISGNIKKDEPQRLRYPEIEEESNEEYSEEDEFEEDCHGPPRTHTGGKWKPSSSPIQVINNVLKIIYKNMWKYVKQIIFYNTFSGRHLQKIGKLHHHRILEENGNQPLQTT